MAKQDTTFEVEGVNNKLCVKESTKEADFEMEMYNADGSRSEMCGNGMRCVGKYVYDYGLTNQKEFSVVSAGKIKYLTLTIEDGKAVEIRVNMGSPILTPAQIPVVAEGEMVIDEPIAVLDKEYKMTCVSMGNPHAVVFMDDVANLDISAVGPYFENHERFSSIIQDSDLSAEEKYERLING